MERRHTEGPLTPESFVGQAAVARRAGNVRAAERSFKAIAAIWPDRQIGYVNLLGMSMSRPAGHGSDDTRRSLGRARTLAGTDARVLRNIAIVATHAGIDAVAEDLRRRALVAVPDDARLWRVQAGDRTAWPIQCAAVLLNPQDMDLLRICVRQRAALQEWPKVLSLLRFAHGCDPADAIDLAEAQNQALVALDRQDEALAVLRQRIAAQPSNRSVWVRIGVLLRTLAKLDEGRAALVRSVVLDPSDLRGYAALGRLELEAMQAEDARRILALARIASPGGDQPWIDRNLAAALVFLRRGEEAGVILRRYLVQDPGEFPTVLNLASAEQYAMRLEAAGTWMRRASLLSPDSMEIPFNAGLLARHSGDPARAMEILQQAVDLQPDHPMAQYTLATVMLQDGDRRQGVRAYMERFKAKGFSTYRQLHPEPTLPVPVWDLSPAPDANLFVWGEQGIGDEIWFSQYLHAIRDRIGSVTLEVAAKLVPLFSRSFPWARVLPRGAEEAEAAALEADLQLPLGHLVALSEEVPSRPGYLKPNPELTAALRRAYEARFPGQNLIGISWRSVKSGALMRSFEAPLSAWRPIFDLPNTQFFSLQYKADQEDFRTVSDMFGKRLLADPNIDAFDDIGALAAQVSALDAVVSVANSTVALAHGVDRPGYVPLRAFQDDFRYPRLSDRSHWLPDIRFTWAPMPDRWEDALGTLADRILRDRRTG